MRPHLALARRVPRAKSEASLVTSSTRDRQRPSEAVLAVNPGERSNGNNAKRSGASQEVELD